jgi:hypothetical protein
MAFSSSNFWMLTEPPVGSYGAGIAYLYTADSSGTITAAGYLSGVMVGGRGGNKGGTIGTPVFINMAGTGVRLGLITASTANFTDLTASSAYNYQNDGTLVILPTP